MRRAALFNLEETMVIVRHKELEYKVEKLKYKMVGGHCSGGSESNLNFRLVGKPSRISPHKVLLL